MKIHYIYDNGEVSTQIGGLLHTVQFKLYSVMCTTVATMSVLALHLVIAGHTHVSASTPSHVSISCYSLSETLNQNISQAAKHSLRHHKECHALRIIQINGYLYGEQHSGSQQSVLGITNNYTRAGKTEILIQNNLIMETTILAR